MAPKKVEERAKKLRSLITYHRTLYHVFDRPEIADEAFDTLKNELESIEREYPELVRPDSPTQVVGGAPLDSFKRVEHESPMFSFFDAFSPQEMREWFARLSKFLGYDPSKKDDADPLFYCELKIDGLAVELVYENGIFVQGSTRGDGRVGEDITRNLETISDIPRNLSQLGKVPVPSHLVVRGEVFITLKEFERINVQQKKRGLAPYANTRNLAAGSIRQLDPSIAASRSLRSFQYDIITDVGQRTHDEEHQLLASWGFTINPHNKAQKTLEDALRFRDEWEKKREKLEYEIDGIVVILNNNNDFEAAGVVGKGPRGAIAYKFSPRQATTVLRDVKFQVGRTGVVTPVAVLDPVSISGVTITHATLHNFDEIKRLDARVGDTVIVTRSGDVIPKIVGVIKELRPRGAKAISAPPRCPVDGQKLEYEGVLLRCTNPRCGAKNSKHIIHFVSRNAFDIRGLGKKIVDRFIDEKLIADASDIFSLREGDIAPLEGFGEKSASNLIGQIEKSKKIPVHRFIYALGIFHVGEETSLLLSRMFWNESHDHSVVGLRDFFFNKGPQGLSSIGGVGPVVAKSISDWFSYEQNRLLLARLGSAGIEFIPPPSSRMGKLRGKNIVLTGTLSFPRQRAKEMIERCGGHIQSSVGSSTFAVVAGADPGSKYKRAKELNIPVWDEEEFLKQVSQ